ncbi:MAG: Smr/MutS family protein [Alphaproteobacteria bacterium]|nr:Smr/MutS family protein [Alphaproteobacteria bacterium]
MTKKKSHLTDEDRALWKAVSAQVEPHKKTDTHRKKRTFKKNEESPVIAAPKPIVKLAPKKKWESVTHQPASSAAPKKQHHIHELPAIAGDVADRIKSKKRSIDARMDLHGMTQDVAHRKAIGFINSSYARHLKTVLIITGKGNASSSEGVLQKNLPRWLSADSTTSKHIAGISPAPRELGGSGAFVVTLKRQHKI